MFMKPLPTIPPQASPPAPNRGLVDAPRDEQRGPLAPGPGFVAIAGTVGKTMARRLLETIAPRLRVVEFHGNERETTSKTFVAPTVVAIPNLEHDPRSNAAAGASDLSARLLESLPAHGLAVLNGDDAQLRRLRFRSRARVQWVGRGVDCDLVATNVRCTAGRLQFEVEGQTLGLNVWGRHHLSWALAAVAIGRHDGITWEHIQERLARFESLARCCQVESRDGTSWIDDTANGRPEAYKAALDLLREFDAQGQRIVVCGDLDVARAASADAHRELGYHVVTSGAADWLVAWGEHATHLAAGARRAGMPRERVIACNEAEQVVSRLSEVVSRGDVVLMHGQQSLHDRLASRASGEFSARAA